METTRFWELVDLLGGVADDDTTPRLDAALADETEAEEFADLVEEAVHRLLERCAVPPSHAGDTAEWIAAAVVASGRTTYERTLAAGGLLSPDDWAWAEAENLLVAGLSDDEEGAGEADLTLQWCSSTVPPGVSTAFEADLDFGDDPAWGRVVTHDEAWEAALGLLDEDAEYLTRRESLGDIRLHIVVRDVEEMELSAWPEPESVEDVVLVVPAPLILAEDSRVDGYLEAVVTIVTSVQAQLGIAD